MYVVLLLPPSTNFECGLQLNFVCAFVANIFHRQWLYYGINTYFACMCSVYHDDDPTANVDIGKQI